MHRSALTPPDNILIVGRSFPVPELEAALRARGVSHYTCVDSFDSAAWAVSAKPDAKALVIVDSEMMCGIEGGRAEAGGGRVRIVGVQSGARFTQSLAQGLSVIFPEVPAAAV